MGMSTWWLHVHCCGELVPGRDHQASRAVRVGEEAEDEGGWDCLKGVVDWCFRLGGRG
jgi:hypothetical protein